MAAVGEDKGSDPEEVRRRTFFSGWFKRSRRKEEVPDQQNDEGDGRECRPDKKVSWSKWKKRLASLHRGSGRENPEESAPTQRALPPVPVPRDPEGDQEEIRTSPSPRPILDAEEAQPFPEELEDDPGGIAFFPSVIDFATSIEKVKSYGWYWGPISRVASERLLANEPDGSFIVRDSSADHYIFSLTFKLDNKCSHVRIENHQGNFSFGSLQNFKSNTIVDFIENAVEHSRSGRYLFFLHRRPQRGPMQVQLLNPVSRFKHVQSLQHMCRFVILKLVPRELLSQLPVPSRIRSYLDTPFYYSERIADWLDLEPDQPPSRQPPTVEIATATLAQDDDADAIST